MHACPFPRVLLLYSTKVSALSLPQVTISSGYSLCLHQAHPSALTVNLHPFLCFYLALCLAVLLPGSGSFFSLAPSPWLLAPPGPLLLSYFSRSQAFSLAYSLTSSSGQRWGMLRNGGRVRAREMRRAEGMQWSIPLLISPSQCIFSPPYSCAYEL